MAYIGAFDSLMSLLDATHTKDQQLFLISPK